MEHIRYKRHFLYNIFKIINDTSVKATIIAFAFLAVIGTWLVLLSNFSMGIYMNLIIGAVILFCDLYMVVLALPANIVKLRKLKEQLAPVQSKTNAEL